MGIIKNIVNVKGYLSGALALKHQNMNHFVYAQQQARTPEQAKELVFAHWKQLDKLCKRRFPQNENLAYEGSLFILEQLEANQWKRIRAWEGSGQFITFLTTLISNLLTDFTRKKFGHIRMPQWLSKKKDPLWGMAYQLLIGKQYLCHEVVNMLETNQPSRERWFLKEVVSTIRARCHTHVHSSGSNVQIENYTKTEFMDSISDAELSIDTLELMDAFCRLLDLHNKTIVTSTSRVRELILRLKPHVNLIDEDRLLLRLRFVEGFKMKDIAMQLNLTEDPYKRYYKILRSLRNACRQAGMC